MAAWDPIATNSKTCETHGEYKSNVYKFASRMLEGGCPSCEESKREAQQEADRAAMEQEHTMARVKAIRAPRRFEGANFDNYECSNDNQSKIHRTCLRYASTFPNQMEVGRCLIMCGKPGTGKTHLGIAIAKAVASQGVRARYVDALTMFQDVKKTYASYSERTEAEVMDFYSSIPLLVIDEIGVQFNSETEKMILFEVINRRYGEMLPTIVISNLSRDELESAMGERVMDRLLDNRGLVLPFSWSSERQK